MSDDEKKEDSEPVDAPSPRDYKVGYKKPPMDKRFKLGPGRSGDLA